MTDSFKGENNIYDFESSVFQKAKAISNLAYWSYTFSNDQLICSEEAYRIFDLNPKTKLLNRENILDFIHPDDKKQFIEAFDSMLSNEVFKTFNLRIVVSDGSIKYLMIKVLVEKDENQIPVQIYGTVTDETEIHFKTELLASRENLYRNLFNKLTDIFIVFGIVKNDDGTIQDYIFKNVNPTYVEKFGKEKGEVIDTRLSLQSDIFQQLNPLFNLTIISGQPQQDRLFIQSLDGFFDVLIYSANETTLAAIFRDVSLIVDADNSLRESEEKYRQIFSIGSDALFMTEFSTGKILDVNPMACKMFAYKKSELLKMTFRDMSVNPQVIENEISVQKSFLLNDIYLKSDGSKIPVEITLSYFNWSGRKVVVASVRDITERITAQENLVRSEEKFKQLFNFSNDAVLIIKNYRIIDYNQKAVSLFKVKTDELINKTVWNLSPGKQIEEEDSRTKAVEYLQNSLLGKQLQFEWIFQKNDGSLFTADIKLSPITFGNEKVVQAIVRDISDQKETQEALKSKEQRWKLSLEISSIGVWDWNVQTNEIYFSAGWKAIIGYESKEIPNKFEEFEKRIHPDDVSKMYNYIDEYLTSRIDNYQIDFRMRCKNGTYKWIRSTGKVVSYDSHGKAERFIGTNVDITKQKILEDKLLVERNEFNIASEISKMGYWEVDLRTMIISGSRQTFEIFGYEGLEQLSMRQLEILIHPEDRKSFISQFVSPTTSSNNEYVFRVLVNNLTKFIISKSRPIKNNDNVLMGYKGVFQDITSLKQEEINIRSEQSLLKSFTDNLQDSLLIVQDEQILFLNDRMSDLTGFSNKEITSEIITPFKLAVPEDRILIKRFIDLTNLNNSVSEKFDIRIETRNGRMKWVELRITSFIFKNSITFIYVMSDITERKNQEIEITNSEKWFRSVATQSPSGILILSPDENILYFNNALQQITGMDVLTLKTKGFYSIFNNRDSEEIQNKINSIFNSGKELFPKEVQLANNKKWILIDIKPIQSVKSKIDYYIIVIEDIEARKNNIKNIETENTNLNTILENTNEGIALFNKENKLAVHNSKFIELLNEASLSQDNIVKAINNNDFSQKEIQTKNNKYFTYEIKEKLIDNFKVHSVIIKDITHDKIVIEDANNQIEKFRNIFEKSPLGIALIDKNRQIIFSNKQYAQLFGYELDELMMKKIDEITFSEYLGETISQFSQIFTGVKPTFNQKVIMYNKNGEKIWVNSNIAQLKDKYGDTSCAIQIVENISNNKNEEQKNLANERLRTIHLLSNKYFNDLFGLLNTINKNAYLLKTNLKDELVAGYAETLTQTVNSVNEISRKLIPFSDRNNKVYEIVSTKKLIEEIIKELEIPSTVKITKTSESQNDRIEGDPILLKPALKNIIINSIESLTDGGEISISINSVYFDNCDKKLNSELSKGRYLRITISDTGRGISQNDKERIFDPFYTTKTSSSNSGIGLTVSNKVINQHNGVIKVFSSKDEGTKFNVYLPQNENNIYDLVVTPDEKHLSKGLLKMLIIDDEEITRDITSKLAVDLGYDTFCFSGAKKALKFFKINSKSIDIVLLDSELPKVDGISVLGNLKTINPNVRVVLTSASSSAKTKESDESLMADGIVKKPVSIEKLLSVL